MNNVRKTSVDRLEKMLQERRSEKDQEGTEKNAALHVLKLAMWAEVRYSPAPTGIVMTVYEVREKVISECWRSL
jgi:hypothetical protein